MARQRMRPLYPAVFIDGARPTEDESGVEPYAPPADVKFEAGYGASVEDLKRGWRDPDIRDVPEYTFENYRQRGTLPKEPDLDDGARTADEQDYRFRAKGMRSSGFLTRGRQ